MAKATKATMAACAFSSPQLGAAFVSSAPRGGGLASQVSSQISQKKSASLAEGVLAPEPSKPSSTGTLGALGMLATAAAVVKGVSDARSAKKNMRAQGLVAVAAFESELGVQAPVGYWDPLGLSKDGDVDSFTRRRVTEIKHGRVSMFACLGYIVPEYFKWPGYCSPSLGLQFQDIPNGLGALSKVPGAGWVQIFLFAGIVEKGLLVYDPSRAPGDYENGGVLGVPNGSTLPAGESKNRKLSAELANGRLAMMAIIGMFYQDGLTGSAWGDWSLYTDSPLRAFENELGVQAPVGYWDPAGFAKDGNAESFKRRREIEIKHGRVSMIACIGYITPEYFKWPGVCAPSMGLEFQDVPNGLAAFSKIPSAGWLQIFLFCGVVDTGYFQYDETRGPGDRENGGILGVPNGTGPITDPEARKTKLNAELANGRLAMMAIIGMFFQDGLTGSAWGDWANYEASPLRAFEAELGVQAPVGYWDPLGLSKDGDVTTFQRRRETEIKHGRVSMIATMGYITPEYFKFPGYLSPSAGIKFADVPGGLAALSKVPGAGISQIVLFAGWVEFNWGFEAYKKGKAPGDYGWKFITSSDKEVVKKKLNAELANGRLAMMAIIGMFYQDGLTGSAWGDWSLYTDSPLRAGRF